MKENGFYDKDLRNDLNFLLECLQDYAFILIRHSQNAYELLSKLGWNHYKDLDNNIITIQDNDQLVNDRIYLLFKGYSYEYMKRLSISKNIGLRDSYYS